MQKTMKSNLSCNCIQTSFIHLNQKIKSHFMGFYFAVQILWNQSENKLKKGGFGPAVWTKPKEQKTI